MIVKAIPLHVNLQVEEVARLLDKGQLVDVGDLWTGKLANVKCPFSYLRSQRGVGWVWIKATSIATQILQDGHLYM